MYSIAMAIVFVLVTVLSCSAQVGKERRENSTRQFLEEHFKKEFEDAIAGFKPGGSKEERQDATDGVKMLLYNKAYFYYSCMMANPIDTPIAAINMCVRKQMEHIPTFMGLSAKYGAVIGRERAAKCERRHRLFKSELEFPPFDFLKGAATILYDVPRFNECLMSD